MNGNGNGSRGREAGNNGQSRPFEQAETGQAQIQMQAPTQRYEQRDPWIAQQEERERTQTTEIGPNPMSVAQSVAPGKPLRIYPFGVGRNRLEAAIKNLRIPATIVREIADSDLVMTLKNYYRKSPQSLRGAESAGVPVFVLRSNTQMQIEWHWQGYSTSSPLATPQRRAGRNRGRHNPRDGDG